MSGYDTYKGINNTQYILDKELGKGGEGIVYSIKNNSSMVAKIYKDEHFKNDPALRETTHQKLKVMLKLPVKTVVDGKLRLAWPQDILYQNGVMKGFIMPKIDSQTKIFTMYRGGAGSQREKLYPDYSWLHSVQFAYLLSWVVSYVHQHGIVIGDLNPNNIVVDTKNATVILIDCDSFDITDPVSKEHFPCTVGLEEVLAPELQQVGSLRKAKFTKESDNFSLAIHIFRLLMDNADPFGSKDLDSASRSSSTISGNTAIMNGECVYVRHIDKKEIPPGLPGLDIMPESIQKLFQKTFYYDAVTINRRKNGRATALEWATALLPLAQPLSLNKNVKVCNNNKHGGAHIYPNHNSYCPWCKKEEDQKRITEQLMRAMTAGRTKTGKTTSLTKPSVVPRTQQTNTAAAAATTTTTTAGYTPVRRRSPVWLYLIMSALGVLSGFIFSEEISRIVSSTSGITINYVICTIVLSVMGLVIALVMAHLTEDSYVHSRFGFLWLLLGAVALLAPPLLAILLTWVIMLAVTVIVAILQILAVIVVIYCVCQCCD